MAEHLINEIGCLRGAMYIADEIGVDYPKEVYYSLYIKPNFEKMEQDEPLRQNTTSAPN